MDTYRSAAPCVLKQVIKNGFHMALCRPDLHYFYNPATFRIVDKPSDALSCYVSQSNSAQILICFHLSHEIQQPFQGLPVVFGSQRIISGIIGHARLLQSVNLELFSGNSARRPTKACQGNPCEHSAKGLTQDPGTRDHRRRKSRPFQSATLHEALISLVAKHAPTVSRTMLTHSLFIATQICWLKRFAVSVTATCTNLSAGIALESKYTELRGPQAKITRIKGTFNNSGNVSAILSFFLATENTRNDMQATKSRAKVKLIEWSD